MLKVGITGGIGSGKTLVCRAFETLGIPVYNADLRAREIINTHPDIIRQLKALMGDDIYGKEGLDRKRVAAVVFNQSDLLKQLNAITHPAVQQYAEEWMNLQSTPYAIKEAALLFESGSYRQLDVIVGVSAPADVRMARVMQRDGSTHEEVMKRVAGQMDEEEKMRRCHHVIHNDGKSPVLPQIWALHQRFLEMSKTA